MNTAVFFKLTATMMNHLNSGNYSEALSVCQEIEDLIVIQLDKQKGE